MFNVQDSRNAVNNREVMEFTIVSNLPTQLAQLQELAKDETIVTIVNNYLVAHKFNTTIREEIATIVETFTDIPRNEEGKKMEKAEAYVTRAIQTYAKDNDLSCGEVRNKIQNSILMYDIGNYVLSIEKHGETVTLAKGTVPRYTVASERRGAGKLAPYFADIDKYLEQGKTLLQIRKAALKRLWMKYPTETFNVSENPTREECAVLLYEYDRPRDTELSFDEN